MANARTKSLEGRIMSSFKFRITVGNKYTETDNSVRLGDLIIRLLHGDTRLQKEPVPLENIQVTLHPTGPEEEREQWKTAEGADSGT
jgi:hypothetical protein